MSYDPSYPMQQPGYGNQPPAQNGMAIAGFILSIVGFFTCFLTSPVGMIMSIAGMKKTDQQGLAIAGLVLGILGTLSLIGMVVYFVVVMLFLGGMTFLANEAVATASDRAHTMAAIQSAQSEIERHTMQTDNLPSDEQGTQLIRLHLDVWGNSLRYENLQDKQYQIISAGPDEQFETLDDISSEFRSMW